MSTVLRVRRGNRKSSSIEVDSEEEEKALFLQFSQKVPVPSG